MNWISTQSITTDLIGSTKKDIFEELLSLLECSNKVIDRQQILEDVLIRDSLSQTVLFDHVSIPHARSLGVLDLCASIGIKHHSGALFGTQSEAKTHKPDGILLPSVFIMVIWPENTPDNLHELGRLISHLSNQHVVQKLLEANTPELVLNCLRSGSPVPVQS